jgi:ferritin-like metal-binding protein YciE
VAAFAHGQRCVAGDGIVMQESPLLTTLYTLLAQHHATLRGLSGDFSKLVGTVQDEKLSLCLEEYLDRATDELRDAEGLLRQRKLKPQSAPDKAIGCLVAEANAAQELDLPGEVLDVLLARAFLRIQHCQIAALGVLQTLAEVLEEREILVFAREALGAEIEGEETLSTLLENELAAQAAGANA